ncbi:putative DNA modification protein [Bacillus phage vB_BspS_SplendidRed]|uniref:Putative DNA modification protein n=1 Tax=Bacillus phage vB_BspS_SplendidRed TaxID=2591379 RepID=A0A5B9NMY8_9CAUD|nr:putative DNA modification protein [Bacillus phage vB_BspS_SplendidRed]QEG13500.1 putative DNA modification protein [Bacillus phage vB_BspS_SplendidRed]
MKRVDFVSVRDFKVDICDRSEIKSFIEEWHYSKSINGLMSDYCFKLMDGEKIIGAMIYGGLAMANAWKKYGESKDDVIELRRLCCIDETPKNTESYFIGQTIRWLKKNTDIKVIVSYADPEYNHTGVIYKATNFKHCGFTAKGKVIIHNGKKYHDKAIRTKYKGELKPFARRLKEALEKGEAYYKNTQGKHIYVYNLT